MPIATSHDLSLQDELIDDLGIARAFYDRGEFSESAELAMQIYADSTDAEKRFRAVLLASSSESEQRHYAAALKTLDLASPLLDDAIPYLKANYFCQRAHVKVKLNPKSVDCGVIDYEEAIYYAREAGYPTVEARARNNLARRYSKANRFDEAITEVDSAIQIAMRLGEQVELGRFYDQKAQILSDHKHYDDALKFSDKAMRALADHPALAEARTTHGRALAALASEYLEQDDPVDTFSGKRQAAECLTVSLDANLIQLALDRASGNLTHAADLLHVSHAGLIKLIKKFKLDRKPIRPRGKSLNRK